uniref:Uncharacterized protein n=1 Tax=Lepeophtheirus salmonis TaxID=72036 RepID=A0A0K2VL10_LEPSM
MHRMDNYFIVGSDATCLIKEHLLYCITLVINQKDKVAEEDVCK